nr:Na+/H+ antiporter NhaA [Micromonospora echinaurantiaca]
MSLRLGHLELSHDLQTWINSGLMTLFFLVVGLEARREFDLGDLRDRRRFVLPSVAGVIGMLIPVLIFLGSTTAGRARTAGAWLCRPTPPSRWACWHCSAGACPTGSGSSCSPCSWSTT